MTQTRYCGLLVSPSGHRFVMQAGTHTFAAAGTTVTLTVQMKRLVSAFCNPEETPAGAKLTNLVGSYIPFVSASQLTIGGLPYPYRVVVSRLYGKIASPKFHYMLLGW